MTNKDPAQSIRPLVDYIKTQIPAIHDQHAEILATQIIAGLPRLFAEKPEIFSSALSTAVSRWKSAISPINCQIMKIILKTGAGHFVHEAEVIPPNGYPEVIIWGSRIFTIFAPGEYREATCCVLPSIPYPHPENRT